VAALRSKGYGVTIEHLASDSDAHKVTLLVGGTEMCSSADLQHNRNYGSNKKMSEELVQQLEDKLAGSK